MCIKASCQTHERSSLIINMLNLPDRQIERHMASQSAEKEAKQRMSFNLLTILLMFFSVSWSPEVSLLSLGPWLFS